MGFEADSEIDPITPKQEAALMQLTVERAAEELVDLEVASTDQDRFYALPSAAIAAYYLERFDLAAELATEALDRAPSYVSDWNYGNAIHWGHTVLGLLALRAGDLKRATEELHSAGATRGSPQLDTFGPSMRLAKDLLHAQRPDEVLAYLGQCRKFWKMGAPWLDVWEPKIRAGSVPNFFMHLAW